MTFWDCYIVVFVSIGISFLCLTKYLKGKEPKA
jgi:hypothetical protein